MMYLLLLMAIVVGCLGDITLKKSHGFRRKGLGFLAVIIYLFAFYLMSVIVKVLPVSVVYATWSGIGVVLAALIGVFLFKEKTNWKAVASMGVIVLGVVLLNTGGGLPHG
ncbi:DMT family transporter [Virgibacillus kekensis]|uniref:DMT family transporter n=1 Tax=Virgibacillus kekensis TaxID=202261 RepID=A0ABV9DLS0_9BACI